MNRTEIIMDMRTSRLLFGRKPAIISVFPNYGGIAKKGRSYVVTISDDDKIYFQGLTRFLKIYKAEYDFSLKFSEIKSYKYVLKNPFLTYLTIYTKNNNFLPMYYSIGLKDTVESENNLNNLIKLFEEHNISLESD